jgi:hypothetical protein
MSLFPTAHFRLMLERGQLSAGEATPGTLVISAPEPIPRAERVLLFATTVATAGYGSGKNRSVYSRSLASWPLQVALPPGPLPAGEHSYPFNLQVPAWLTSNFEGNDCSLRTSARVSLDVDWALDPDATFALNVAPRPVSLRREVGAFRSPAGFHKSIVIEVALAANAILPGEPLRGEVAVRGQPADLCDVVLTLQTVAHIVMGRGDARASQTESVRIPKAALQGGRAVSFAFPDTAFRHPNAQNGFIDISTALDVSLDVPWAFDPHFSIPIHVAPPGSVLLGSGSTYALGEQRLLLIGQQVATATGFSPGQPPLLAAGRVGSVVVSIWDAPQGGHVGASVTFEFPDLDLDLTLRARSFLGKWRKDELLSVALREKFYADYNQDSGLTDPAAAALFEGLLGQLPPPSAIQLADHHLRLDFMLAADGPAAFESLARLMVAHARRIGAAISNLPFPASLADQASTWRACAATERAALVPSGPALLGVVRSARVAGGETRTVRASLRGRVVSGGHGFTLHVACEGFALPPESATQAQHVTLEGARRVFTTVQIHTDHVTLERTVTTTERVGPGELLLAIEAVLAFMLEVRGERQVDAPYR